MAVKIRPLAISDFEVCYAIMRSLPEWFGHEGGLADCAVAVRTGRGWVADRDGTPIAFATWSKRTPFTAEITWMAVHRDARDAGVGTMLLEHVCSELRGLGYALGLP